MIPVNSHIDTVKMARQRRVKKLMIKDLDNLVEFDPQLVASVSKSDIPYEVVRQSQDIYSFTKQPKLPGLKKRAPSHIGLQPVHDCGNAVPIAQEPQLTSADVIKYWHGYYARQKAKREAQAQLPEVVAVQAAKAKDGIREPEVFNELKWDEYALSLVSKNMQEYITFKANSRSASNYHRLTRNYITKFGRPKELDKIELIDDLFDEERKPSGHGKRSEWIKEEMARVMPAIADTKHSLKLLSDGRTSLVVEAKEKRRVQLAQNNKKVARSNSATDIASKKQVEDVQRPRTASPPPIFQKELVSGAKQLYFGRKENEITFSSGKRFSKKLQPVFPNNASIPPLNLQFRSKSNKSSNKSSESAPHSRAPSRGHRRWIKEPDYIDNDTELVNRPYEYVDEDEVSIAASGRSSSRLSNGSFMELGGAREGTQSRLESFENTAMRAEMAADWRNKWRVNLADTADPNELLQLLVDLHPFTRVRGIVTITYIAHGQHSSVPEAPNYLLKAIEAMVTQDPDMNVRKAASICLSSLCRFSEAIKKILLEIIRDENSDSADKWSAAQGLAHNTIYTSDVISVFVRIYVDNYSPDGADDPRRQTALKLIQIISSGTALAAGMAGELLSNSDWDVRKSACRILGACHGPLPADVVSKLNELMWTDWSEAVRVAAAHALGQAGHGLDVHHELVNRLQSKNGAERTRALRLISIVGFMTVRLMPLYLDCFRDTYTDVREAACSVASRLYKQAAKTKSLLDQAVCERLIEIMQFDTASAVRRSAIDALENCLIALDTADPPPSQTAALSASLFRASSPTQNQLLRDKMYACFVWAMQTAAENDIRLRALLILRRNEYGDGEFAEILRQRLLAENADDVRKELEISLEDCLKRVHSASRQLPLLGDLRKNIHALSRSTMGIVERLEKFDKKERLREFKAKCLIHDTKKG